MKDEEGGMKDENIRIHLSAFVIPPSIRPPRPLCGAADPPEGGCSKARTCPGKMTLPGQVLAYGGGNPQP